MLQTTKTGNTQPFLNLNPMVARWVPVEERYPEITAENPYPTCIVWLECVSGQGQLMHGIGSMHFGELRLLGGDKTRPYFVSINKADNLRPLENPSWKVTYWLEWTEGGNKHGMFPNAPYDFFQRQDTIGYEQMHRGKESCPQHGTEKMLDGVCHGTHLL